MKNRSKNVCLSERNIDFPCVDWHKSDHLLTPILAGIAAWILVQTVLLASVVAGNPAGRVSTPELGKNVPYWRVVDSVLNLDEQHGVLRDRDSLDYLRNPTAAKLVDQMDQEGKIAMANDHGDSLKYVVDMNGEIWIGKNKAPHPSTGEVMFWPHPTLIGGKDPRVLGAGILRKRNGRIISVDNLTGHFRCNSLSFPAVKRAFERLRDPKFVAEVIWDFADRDNKPWQEEAKAERELVETQHKLLNDALLDLRDKRISLEDFERLIRDCNRRHSQYRWKFEKRFIREYTVGDTIYSEYEIRFELEELD